MKSLILAGGEGLRLQELIRDIPKPMAPVAGKPFLEYLILQLVKCGFGEIIISIGYKGDSIKSYFGSGKPWSVKITYAEEDGPLGTGGALAKASEWLDSEPFVVMNGDSFFEVDISQNIAFHRAKNATATLGLASVDDVSRYGRVDINENGEILSFIEKGQSGGGLINGGVYVFNREIVDIIPPGKVSLEKEVLPLLVKKGLYGLAAKGYFTDIGIPQDYLSLHNNPEMLLNAIGR